MGDLLPLALAALVCAIVAFTSVMLLDRRARAGGGVRRGWIVGSGLVTGLGVWVVHLVALLEYAPSDIHFDVRLEAYALLAALAASVAGWSIATIRRPAAPAFGGAIVGAGAVAALYLGTASVVLPGRHLALDWTILLPLAALGMLACALAGRSAFAGPSALSRVVSSAALASGLACFYLAGSHGIVVQTVLGPLQPAGSLSGQQLGGFAILAVTFVQVAALIIAYYDNQLASRIFTARLQAGRLALSREISEDHHKHATDFSPQMPWVANASGQLIEVSLRWGRETGLDSDDLLGARWLKLIHPDDLQSTNTAWLKALRLGTAFDTRHRMRQRDGGYRWFRSRASGRRDPNGAISAWYGTVEDIHDHVAAEHALERNAERHRMALGATSDAIWDWDHGTGITSWGDSIATQFGHQGALSGTDFNWWSDHVHPGDRDAVIASLTAALAGDALEWQREFRFRRDDETYSDIVSRGRIIRDGDGKPLRTIGSMVDVTQRNTLEASLRRTLYHDPLTQLPNRLLFDLRLGEALADAAPLTHAVSVILLDIDNFTAVNDTFGHGAGDRLLQTVADRLRLALDVSTTIARLDGDEFAIILPGLSPGAAAAEATRHALAALDAAFDAMAGAFGCSASFGAAIWPVHGDDAATLLHNADAALHAARSQGGGGHQIFGGDMPKVFAGHATMLQHARDAVHDDRIVPYYQPQVDLRSGRVSGFEALLRWRDAQRDVQLPGGIMAGFRDMDLAARLTDRMVDLVVDDVADWLNRGLIFHRVAINAAPADFLRDDFAERFLETLRRRDVPPTLFELEVTEAVFMGKDAGLVSRTLQTLSAAGVTIALDDFGTGYASLTHLRHCPVDVLKIDQSFVHRLVDGDGDIAIIRALIGLAKGLGIGTVAEGIETVAQAVLLRDEGCDVGQGFLFSRAVAAAEVGALIVDLPRTIGRQFATQQPFPEPAMAAR